MKIHAPDVMLTYLVLIRMEDKFYITRSKLDTRGLYAPRV